MKAIIVKHMLADKTKMKNAIMGFSQEFPAFKIVACEILPDKTNPSLLKTKIVSEDKEQAEKFISSKKFREHLHQNLKNRFEIVFENTYASL